MSDVLLRLDEVSRMVGLNKTAIYRHILDGDFPAPVKIASSSRWVEAEIQAWIDALKAARNGDQIGDEKIAA